LYVGNVVLGPLLLLLAGGPVEVTGDVACPAVAAVEVRLARLLGPGEHPAHRVVLSLAAEAAGVRVDLLAADGAAIAGRTLDAAAWEAKLDPGVTAAVALPAPPPPPPAPAPPPPAPPEVRAAPDAPAAQAPRFVLGVGLLSSVAGGDVAPGASIVGAVSPAGWRAELAGALSATTAHTTAVGGLADAAHWTRFALSAGPGVRLGGAQAALDLHAAALAALLHVQGVGLPVTSADTSLQLGASAGARVAWPWGNAAVWLGVDLLLFPGHDRLEVTGLSLQGELPRVELQLGAGLSMGRFR
jgi:hypothetical protein